MSSHRSAPGQDPIRLQLSSARAGVVAAATFVVPATCAAVAAVVAPDVVWNFVGAVVAIGLGLYLAAVYRNQPWLLEIASGEVRLRTLRRQWSVPVASLTEVAVVRAHRWEFTRDRDVNLEYDHVYLTFQLPPPADRPEIAPLPRLTANPTRDPDATATAEATRVLATSPLLTVRVAGMDDRKTSDLLARLAAHNPGVEVRHPEVRSVRVRRGWSQAYEPWRHFTEPAGSPHPVWALEDAARLHPDHDLRELGGVAIAVIATLVWLGDMTLAIAALTSDSPG